jgi:hypothetical protein
VDKTKRKNLNFVIPDGASLVKDKRLRRSGIYASHEPSSKLVNTISRIFWTNIGLTTVCGMDPGSAPLTRLVRGDEGIDCFLAIADRGARYRHSATASSHDGASLVWGKCQREPGPIGRI